MFKKLMTATLVAIFVAASGMSAISALAAPAAATQDQTASDTAGLLYMYEEEKLARDVYNALYTLWGQPTFQSIAASEQTHMDAVKTLLIRYGIAVPENTPGVFSNASLQSLYTNLMTTGRLSLTDALKVGALIEETDIADLQTRLAQTTSADIQLVYNNLMSGSSNHLRNFVNVLSRLTGEVYQPQILSATVYQSIVTGTNGKGYGQGGSTGTTTTMQGNGSGYSQGSSAGSTTTTQGTCTGTCVSTGTTGLNRGYRGGR